MPAATAIAILELSRRERAGPARVMVIMPQKWLMSTESFLL